MKQAHFLPVPTPPDSEHKQDALLLAPILEKYPRINFFSMRLLHPELHPDTIISGLYGLFAGYMAEQQKTNKKELLKLLHAALQVQRIELNDNFPNLMESELKKLYPIVIAEMEGYLDGTPAGFVCFLTALPAYLSPESAPEEKAAQKTGASPPAERNKNNEILPRRFRKVDRYSLQTDAVTRNLAQLLPEENEIYVGKARRGSKRNEEISCVVTLDFPEQLHLEENHFLSSYDKAILNAISSLYMAGVRYFTIPMLYHAMTGIENRSMPEDYCRPIRERLEFMRRTTISIDYSQEAAASFIGGDLTKLVINDYLLPMKRLEATINGFDVQAYHITAAPPLYAYSSRKKQLSVVKLSLLNAPLNNNTTTIPMKNYILTRIEGMKNRHNRLKSNKILLKSLYDELGEPSPTKLRRKRIRDYLTVFLNFLCEKKYILGYTYTKCGTAYDGVEIELPPSRKVLLAPTVETLPEAKHTHFKPKRRRSPNKIRNTE